MNEQIEAIWDLIKSKEGLRVMRKIQAIRYVFEYHGGHNIEIYTALNPEFETEINVGDETENDASLKAVFEAIYDWYPQY